MSQLNQDLFVLEHLCYKRHGFFVEFGATNGVTLSNTCLLEREYQWNGILAEPARCWHEQLRENRQCHTSTKCVWEKSGELLTFKECAQPEYSTVQSHINADHHKDTRASGKEYQVETISLKDLLAEFNAPKLIDYLSIDTEGTEFDILQAFDWSKHRIEVITVEHNYTPQRELIHSLLINNGYKRVHEDKSQWDDWYVLEQKTPPDNQ